MEIWRRQWMLRSGEFFVCLMVQFVFYVIGMLLFWAMEPQSEALLTGIPMGSVLGYGAALLLHAIYGIFSLPEKFNLAVSMGETRKRFMWGYLLFGLAELVGVQIAAGILQKVEIAIYGVLFGGTMIDGSPIAGEVLASHLFLIELGILAVEMLAGALMLRFSSRVLWGVMAVVLGLPSAQRTLIARGLLPEHILVVQAQTAGKMDMVYAISWLAVYAAVWLLLLAAAWGLLRKQQVTGWNDKSS